jgi:DsbC/DsbD-like thiol-disulfide interchange protein
MTIAWPVIAASLTVAFLVPGPALAGGASPWAQGFHSRVRLVSGGSANGEYLAGVEIALDSGFKTYWRHPGESGLPPRFDWSKSGNAGAIDLQWPAPARTRDAGGVAYGYKERVVFPVRVKALDAHKPVPLRLLVDYGVCKDICIPARAELGLSLSGDTSYRALIEQALASVPQLRRLGTDETPAVTGIERVAADKPTFTVEVRAGAGATLFAEGPENWYVSTSAPQDDGRFTVIIEERPKNADGPVTLRLTLVAGEQAVETEVLLDESLQPR